MRDRMWVSAFGSRGPDCCSAWRSLSKRSSMIWRSCWFMVGLLCSTRIARAVRSLFALTREAEQQLKEVDEVQVQRQRPPDRELGVRFLPEALGVLLLDALCVVGGQPREHEHANDRDRKLQRARA